MKFAFRADASTRIGSGHVMRCATLADELRSRGHRVHFICRELPGHYIDWLRQREYTVLALPEPGTTLQLREGYAAWLGVEAAQEEIDSRTALSKLGGVDWLVVDHYALAAPWEKAMRPFATKLMVIDDLADRAHDCDFLLDQNLQRKASKRYESLLPARCKPLLGPRYALLRPEFRYWRGRTGARDGKIVRLLIFFGGSDADNLTVTTLRALAELHGEWPHLRADVVIGAGNPNTAAVAAACKDLTWVSLHQQVDNMAELMAAAHLAIGAAGASTWERAALGLPSLVVNIADNQRDIAMQAADAGILTWLGDAKDVPPEDWRSALRELLSDPAAVRMQSQRGQALVDAEGCARVADLLLAETMEAVQ